MKNSKKRYLIFSAAGFFLGMLLFCIIYGTQIIDPTYDTWVANGRGDLSQHYLGWTFYRKTPWKFPIGLADGIIGNDSLSVIYTDSIPFLAVFFKLLSPVLPKTFQYLGMWGLLSWGLKGAFSTLLLMRFSKNPVFCLVGSTCFVTAPVVLTRLYSHEALGGGQFIIIFALTIWAYQNKFKKKSTPVILWCICSLTAVGVHMYFIPMTYMIMAGAFLHYILENKKILYPVIAFFSSVVLALLEMFCLGAFYGEGSYMDGGLGIYSSNLNTFFNPAVYSKFLKQMNVNDGELEGFGYLGLGMILGLFFAVFFVIYKIDSKETLKKYWKNRYPLIIGCLLTFCAACFLAVCPVVALNGRILFTIPYPHFLFSALSIFRASGRFIWVAVYIIYAGIFYSLSKLSTKRVFICLTLFLTGLQQFDLRDTFLTRRDTYAKHEEFVRVFSEEDEEFFTKDASQVVFLPIKPNHLQYYAIYSIVGYTAYCHDMTLSSFYTARTDASQLQKYSEKYYDDLKKGSGDEHVLYIFFDDKEEDNVIPDNEHLKCKEYDGFTAARYVK